MRRVLIIGATSAIAQSTARIFAARGDALFLAGRNGERLLTIADDVRVRGAVQVATLALDLTDRARHAELLDSAERVLGGVDTVLIAHGVLSDQAACEQSVEATLGDLDINALSAIALLTLIANRFEAQRRGSIAVLSSVAGDRGRKSNYVYGTAKAALSTFVSGLRARLHGAGVDVLTIKPGFVDTPMTAGFRKSALWASPDAIGAGIVRAIDRRRSVVYLPWFWRPLMAIIRCVPEWIFKRLSI
jgi:decaprenylphospho-beta-D-erythro-pentofuranosid-2-ulose 2-reductase